MHHEPRRLVQLTDVADDGSRRTVLVTADPEVVGATERAIRERVATHLAPSEDTEGEGGGDTR